MSSQPQLLISKRAAAAHGRALQRGASTNGGAATSSNASSSTSSSSSSSLLDFVVIGVAVATAAVTGLRLYRAMHVRLPAGSIAVVYNARRRSIFSTPYDQCGTAREAIAFCRSEKGKAAVGGLATIAGLRLVLGAALFPCTKAYLTRPPLPWYKVFSIPRGVISKGEGVQLVCRVTDVPTNSPARVDVEVGVRFYIDLNADLERYLSLCGPVGPSDHVGAAVGYCLRSHAASVDAGVLLSSRRRDMYFMDSFGNHVVSKLLADCAIRATSVTIQSVRESGVESNEASLDATYNNVSHTHSYTNGRSNGNSSANLNAYDNDYDDGLQYSDTSRTTEPYNASVRRL